MTIGGASDCASPTALEAARFQRERDRERDPAAIAEAARLNGPAWAPQPAHLGSQVDVYA